MGSEDMKIGKGCMLTYLIPVQFEPYSASDEKSKEKVIHNLSDMVSETEAETLPAVPVGSKMIFLETMHPCNKFYCKMH